MKTRTVNICLFSCFLFLSGIGYAWAKWTSIPVSVFQQELELISARILALTKYTVDIEFNSYEKAESEIVHDRSEGYVKRNGYMIRSQLLGIITIQNSTDRIVIDSLNKIIAITSPDSMNYFQFYNELSLQFAGKASSVLKLESKGSVSFKVLFGQKSPVHSYLIELDSHGLPKKIDVEYNRMIKNSKGADVRLNMRVHFKNWNLQPLFKNTDFAFTPYLKRKGSKYELISEFSAYQLSDQRVNMNIQ